MQLILASTSPWRRQLLADVGLRVEGVAPGVAEDKFSEDRPVERAIGLARLKAQAVAARSFLVARREGAVVGLCFQSFPAGVSGAVVQFPVSYTHLTLPTSDLV